MSAPASAQACPSQTTSREGSRCVLVPHARRRDRDRVAGARFEEEVRTEARAQRKRLYERSLGPQEVRSDTGAGQAELVLRVVDHAIGMR